MGIDKTTHSFGTILKTGTWSASTPETIPTMAAFGQATNVTTPPLKRSKTKATRLNQANKFLRWRAGMVDGGEIKFDGFFDKADFATLLGMFDNDNDYWWQVCIPEPDDATHLSLFSWHGFATELGMTIEEDNAIMCPVTVCVNGRTQYTAYS